MFIFESKGETVIAPGFLANYRGRVVLSEYSRYRNLLPVYLVVGGLVLAWTVSAFASSENWPILLSFSAFMFLHAIRSFARNVVEVDLSDVGAKMRLSSLASSVDVAISGAVLMLIGIKYQFLTGEFSGLLFKVLGWAMITAAIGYFYALWNRPRPMKHSPMKRSDPD